MAILAEFWAFTRARRKFWLLPVVIIMALLGGLVVWTQGSVFAPFIYTLF